jgi:MFS family permease
VLTDIDWRAPFLLYLLALPAGLVFVRSIPRGVSPTPELPPEGRPSVPTLPTAIAAVTSSGTPGYLPAAQRELRGPTGSLVTLVLTLFVSMATMQSLYYLVALNIPFSLEDRFDASATLIGVVVALLMLAFAIGALGSVRLSQFLQPRATVSVAAALVGVGHVLMSGVVPGAGMVAAVFPATLAAGIGYGLIAPNLIAWLAAVAPPQLRGRLFGGMTGSLFLGQFLSPYVWGPVTSAFGRDGAIAFSGGFALAVCLGLAITVAVLPQRSDVGHATPAPARPRAPEVVHEVPANPEADGLGHGRHDR